MRIFCPGPAGAPENTHPALGKMSNRMTIAQFARLACEFFRQLYCSFFKLIGALAS
jgi:hypothetical protein